MCVCGHCARFFLVVDDTNDDDDTTDDDTLWRIRTHHTHTQTVVKAKAKRWRETRAHDDETTGAMKHSARTPTTREKLTPIRTISRASDTDLGFLGGGRSFGRADGRSVCVCMCDRVRVSERVGMRAQFHPNQVCRSVLHMVHSIAMLCYAMLCSAVLG